MRNNTERGQASAPAPHIMHAMPMLRDDQLHAGPITAYCLACVSHLFSLMAHHSPFASDKMIYVLGQKEKRSLPFLLCINLFVLLGCSITNLKVSCEDASSQAFCIHKTLLLCCVLSLYKLSDFRMIDGGPICPKFCI